MSIAYLPEIYDNELIYSWISRFYCHNGYLDGKDALKDVLCADYGRLSFEFSGLFNSEMRNVLVEQYGDCKSFFLEHTLFAYYSRFYDSQTQSAWLNRMVSGKSYEFTSKLLEFDKRYRYLQFCSACAKEDRFNHGEAYYHREHQIPGVVCCIRHSCFLKTTSVIIHRKKDIGLFPAEMMIPDCDEVISADGIALEYSKYITDILFAPMESSVFSPVGRLLRNRIDNKFLMPLERSINLMAIAEEMLELFKPIGLTFLPYYYLGYVIKGYSHDPRVIIMLAYYLKIPVEELCNPPPSDSSIELYLETERDVYFNCEIH